MAKAKKARKPVSTSELPTIIPRKPGEKKLSAPEGFPVTSFSYSSMQKFTSNPVLFRIEQMNKDRIDTTRSSNSVLGQAIHHGLKTYLGGNDEVPVMYTDTDEDRVKMALDSTIEYIKGVPDGFIDWKTNVPDRGTMIELALLAIPQYIKEWDRTGVKEELLVEKKLEESVRVVHGKREIELPVPLVGIADDVYEDTAGNVVIVDHKTTFTYSSPDTIDGAKLLQAAIYYLLVYATLGRAPHRMVFREYKISNNKDGSAHTREYTIVYDEMPIVFDFFFRLYADMVDALLGKQVFVPNLLALFDRDVAVMAYIYRLDLPDQLESEKKKNKVGDIAELMQKKMSKSRNLSRFLESKASLFTSHVTLNYDRMQSHEKIKYKLMEHGMSLNFADHIEGLAVDLYRFEPSVGIKMTTIEKYRKDIEQVLAVPGVRILAPIPGTNYVGFEVPKKKRSFVDLSELKKPADLEIALGIDVYGEPKLLDIRDMPHLLIAGTTGSGKSNLEHAIIQQLLRLPKTELRLALADPKRVELQQYEDDGHTDYYHENPLEIAAMLLKYVEEMDARYATFKKHKVKNLAEYRKKIDKKIPYVVIAIDEFADLTVGNDVNAKAIKKSLVALAQKARAAGIHLIIATQRPEAKVIDGLIKANFPTRIALRVAGRIDSEIILDRAGAELLLGKGDMLLLANDGVSRLQGYNVES